jgi:squalene-hopene/tetraprenyl-beta-curcumene cyclase
MNLLAEIPGLAETRAAALQRLLDSRSAAGHWEGHLSTSALATATALAALALYRSDPAGTDHQDADDERLFRATKWLTDHQNHDGGWGDTSNSPSNISTTVLGWAALAITPAKSQAVADAECRAEAWLRHCAADTSAPVLAPVIQQRYGTDKTFSVPILTMARLCGRWTDAAWREIPALPLELSILPRWLFAFLRMPVVSYALPALIALGLVRHVRGKPQGLWRHVRQTAIAPALRILDSICPPSGGFLEATPLTSFVLMSLVGAGQAHLEVARKGAAFLRQSQRADGGWPIDTNLATWLTTLAVNALGTQAQALVSPAVRSWLRDQQSRRLHPYTGAAPGGWAWTDLSGGVPDADDTAGALLALRTLSGDTTDAESVAAAVAGCRWLMGLQNADGGVATFCRGWGHLDFDRSSPDITAHAIRAVEAWRGTAGFDADRFLRRARAFLQAAQRPEGCWIPLWFGNQERPDQTNPIYGTARVLRALPPDSAAGKRAVQWLLQSQNADGSFGHECASGRGSSGSACGNTGTIEETALALSALARVPSPQAAAAIVPALRWLVARTDAGRNWPAAPLGLYFARLWYYEELYPILFSVEALLAIP